MNYSIKGNNILKRTSTSTYGMCRVATRHSNQSFIYTSENVPRLSRQNIFTHFYMTISMILLYYCMLFLFRYFNMKEIA